MSFTVYWWPAALAYYRDLWLRSPDPGQMADIYDDLNRALRAAAPELGESRERATVRVWFRSTAR